VTTVSKQVRAIVGGKALLHFLPHRAYRPTKP
jgi:hypothetical protein